MELLVVSGGPSDEAPSSEASAGEAGAGKAGVPRSVPVLALRRATARGGADEVRDGRGDRLYGQLLVSAAKARVNAQGDVVTINAYPASKRVVVRVDFGDPESDAFLSEAEGSLPHTVWNDGRQPHEPPRRRLPSAHDTRAASIDRQARE